VVTALDCFFWAAWASNELSETAFMKVFSTAAWAGLGALVLSSGAAWAQNCSSFQTCAQAVASYKSGNTKLDRDKDGIPCESLCGSNGENMPGR